MQWYNQNIVPNNSYKQDIAKHNRAGLDTTTQILGGNELKRHEQLRIATSLDDIKRDWTNPPLWVLKMNP